MNEQIEIQVTRIKHKIAKQIANMQLLQKENEQLKTKLAKVTEEIGQQEKHIAQLKQQVETLQLLQTNMAEGEKKALIKSLDKYIADINKTIVLLSDNHE
jgi:regulator of replication initiation timing